MRPPEIIETPRLALRQPMMTDAEAIFTGYAQDAEVAKYLIWHPHKDLDETLGFVKRCVLAWKDGSAYPWVITQKEDGRLIGMIEGRVRGFSMDIGYVLARTYWGRGYMPEAARS